MEAKKFRNVILFIANRWTKQTVVAIFGEVMGLHFWRKWISAYGEEFTNSYRGPDYATMRLFYEMGNEYLQILLDYIEANYNG